MAEHGPGLEGEFPAAVLARKNYPGASDVGRHQVHGELDAVEAQVEREAERLDQRGFAGAGNALDQHVASGEERAQEFFDGSLMAHDHFMNLGLDVAEGAPEVGHAGHFGGGGYIHRSNTRLIVTRSEAGIDARSKGSSGAWLALSVLVVRRGGEAGAMLLDPSSDGPTSTGILKVSLPSGGLSASP